MDGFRNLPAFLRGFPRMLVGAPELHHWHHDRDRDAGDCANLSLLLDLLFGTCRCPHREAERFGLREESPPDAPGPSPPALPATQAPRARPGGEKVAPRRRQRRHCA